MPLKGFLGKVFKKGDGDGTEGKNKVGSGSSAKSMGYLAAKNAKPPSGAPVPVGAIPKTRTNVTPSYANPAFMNGHQATPNYNPTKPVSTPASSTATSLSNPPEPPPPPHPAPPVGDTGLPREPRPYHYTPSPGTKTKPAVPAPRYEPAPRARVPSPVRSYQKPIIPEPKSAPVPTPAYPIPSTFSPFSEPKTTTNQHPPPPASYFAPNPFIPPPAGTGYVYVPNTHEQSFNPKSVAPEARYGEPPTRNTRPSFPEPRTPVVPTSPPDTSPIDLTALVKREPRPYAYTPPAPTPVPPRVPVAPKAQPVPKAQPAPTTNPWVPSVPKPQVVANGDPSRPRPPKSTISNVPWDDKPKVPPKLPTAPRADPARVNTNQTGTGAGGFKPQVPSAFNLNTSAFAATPTTAKVPDPIPSVGPLKKLLGDTPNGQKSAEVELKPGTDLISTVILTVLDGFYRSLKHYDYDGKVKDDLRMIEACTECFCTDYEDKLQEKASDTAIDNICKCGHTFVNHSRELGRVNWLDKKFAELNYPKIKNIGYERKPKKDLSEIDKCDQCASVDYDRQKHNKACRCGHQYYEHSKDPEGWRFVLPYFAMALTRDIRESKA